MLYSVASAAISVTGELILCCIFEEAATTTLLQREAELAHEEIDDAIRRRRSLTYVRSHHDELHDGDRRGKLSNFSRARLLQQAPPQAPPASRPRSLRRPPNKSLTYQCRLRTVADRQNYEERWALQHLTDPRRPNPQRGHPGGEYRRDDDHATISLLHREHP